MKESFFCPPFLGDKFQLRPLVHCIPFRLCSFLAATFCLHMSELSSSAFVEYMPRDYCLCVCVCDDNHCQASQICRCLHTFAHERLTLSTTASRWKRSFRKNSRANINTGRARLMSVKLCYISQWCSAGGVFQGWHNTLIRRRFRLMYNNRPTVKNSRHVATRHIYT